MKYKKELDVLDKYFGCHNGSHVHREEWLVIRKELDVVKKSSNNSDIEQLLSDIKKYLDVGKSTSIHDLDIIRRINAAVAQQ